jgi:hypothetical protein
MEMIPPESFHVDAKIKMAMIRHKDILTVRRYFFIEIPESNLGEHNHLLIQPSKGEIMDRSPTQAEEVKQKEEQQAQGRLNDKGQRPRGLGLNSH